MGLFGKLFGRRQPELEPVDLGTRLGTDMHSHFIPGIDDGAPDLETSLELIGAMRDLGYSKVITTPHVMSDYYRNTPEIIRSGLAEVQSAVAGKGWDIKVEAAAEYYLDDDLETKIENKEILTFGDKHVLFELPFISEPSILTRTIFAFQTNGYRPVLAHIERYAFWHNQWNKFEEMRDKGVLIQVNIGSLTGAYGPQVKKIAEKLIDKAMVDILGSDCHHMGHIEMLYRSRTMTYLHRALELDLLNSSL